MANNTAELLASVLRHALRGLGRHFHRDDLEQIVRISVWRSLEAGLKPSAVARRARLDVIDELRVGVYRARNEPRVDREPLDRDMADPNSDRFFRAVDAWDEICCWMKRLTDRDREILKPYVYDGLNRAETAEVVGCSAVRVSQVLKKR